MYYPYYPYPYATWQPAFTPFVPWYGPRPVVYWWP
jgi:hypothetical protein